MTKVLTLATWNSDPHIKLTRSQIQALKKARLWPLYNRKGEAYRSIGKPFKPGQPTWSDQEIAVFIASGVRPLP